MSPPVRVALLLLAAACTRPAPRAAAEGPVAAPRVSASASVASASVASPAERPRARAEPVAALSARADALAGLGRVEEARLAYARALAADPDDAETLLGASELLVRRLGGDRGALLTALEYATRGARAAARSGERDVAARLEVVAGMAQNDLGRSHLALAHLDRAVRARPDDPDAVYERGLALYELCRFSEAQRELERTLALAADDPWALHLLGLVLERRGDPRADELMARARALAPGDFRSELPVDAAAFRREVDRAVASLPVPERNALGAVPLEIRDLPDAADLLAVEPPLSPSILGLFRGPPEGERCLPAEAERCRSIVLYRRNLLRFARDRRELSEQVRITILHELGHLHGEDDDALRERGLE